MSSNSDDRKRPALQSGVNNKKPKTGFVLRKLSGSSRQFTRYNDEVHNSIDLCPVMKVLFDTKQFQRLRSIKQLGTSFFVYANANHTRFEHSVGVAYLAERMCSRIQRYQHSTLETTDKVVLCVTLAGLLHDIGHGPFSHVYEEFRGELAKDIENDSSMSKAYEKFPPVPDKWSHENSSLAMVDAALESLGLAIDMDKDNLDKPLKQIGDGIDARSMRVFKGYTSIRKESAPDDDILTSRDWIFIKECIYGKPIPEVKEKLGIDERIGRLKPKQEWLYDVVANRHNGIDVDKVDYFARDERRSLGEAGNIKIPIIDEARVALATCPNKDCKKCTQGGQHYMICYPKKCVEGVMDFYRNRYKMHTTVYQHKTTTAGACMVVDILKKADLHYLIPAGDQRLPISRAIMNNEAFCRLKDTIIESIAESTSEELRPARELAERFLVRDLYSKFIIASIHLYQVFRSCMLCSYFLPCQSLPERES
jgi:HD superfamily phosphohydrolase